MLTKEITHDCQVLEDGQLQMRTITRIMEDGEELNKHYHRKVVDVGDDVTDEPDLIKEIAGAVHTPQRVAARKAVIALQESKANANANGNSEPPSLPQQG